MTLPGGTPVDLAVPQHAVDQLEPDYASWTLRVIAALLDAAIAAGVAFLAPVGVGTQFPFLGEPASFTGATPTTATWFLNPWVVAVVVVTMVMQAYLGVTPGKLLMGIAVVNEADARPLGLVRTVLRWLAHLVDWFFFIGYLRPLWNSRRKTFADSIVGSIVLVTRRPRPHRWFASCGGPTPDVDPPVTWEAAATPKWRPAATWLAALACGLGGLLGFGPSTTPYRAPVDLQCAMSTWDSGPAGLTGATLRTTPSMGTITRLGVTRWIGESLQDVSVTWTWRGHPSQSDAILLRLVVTSADGTSTTHDFSFSYTSTRSETMSVPSGALRGVGDSWSWAASIVVDDAESTPCTGTVTGLFT